MKLLIIEDDKELRDFMKPALEAELYAVDVASDGEAGLCLATQSEYDLIILDLMLPDMDGLDICEQVRSQGKTVPILVLSANSDTISKTKLLNAGADDYLTKPFALTELTARLKALLRRPTSISEDKLVAGELMLDVVRNEVTKNGEVINLSRKEFMLLRYLMQHNGIVLTRGMLLEHVWDMSIDIFSNTIESHVRSLRKKLGDDNKEYIQTVSGRGYKFVTPSD